MAKDPSDERGDSTLHTRLEHTPDMASPGYIAAIHGKTKIFIDPEIYRLELPYFPNKCLEVHNAGFDLRACEIEDENGRGVETEQLAPQGFRTLEDDTVPGFVEVFSIKPMTPYLYNTGVKMEIPEDFFGDVGLRSSAFKKVAMPSNGTVDCSYRGHIKVAFFSYFPLYIRRYARIAQIKIVPYLKRHEMVSSEDKLASSDRGENGFGSYTNGGAA